MRSVYLALLAGAAAREDAAVTANPIRKVVTMLQAMQKKVEAEGARDKELYDKFMCYCKTGVGSLEQSIGDANTKIPNLQSEIEGSESKVANMKIALKQAQTDRADANAAMKAATALRNNEAATYAKASTELKTNVAAIKKAVTAIDAGMGGAFLQTDAAQLIKNIISSADMVDADREDVTAFLTQGYAPASGGISGILKTMGDEMAADLKSLTSDETSSITSFDALMAAKTKEVEALNKMIETNLGRIGQLSVDIVQMKNDLTDSEESLIEDNKFLGDLKKDCGTKAEEFQEIVKTRQEELLALADTIKLLNDDDALELFKKTLPGGASLMQTHEASASLYSRALLHVQMAQDRATASDSPRLDFIALALKGKKIGFDKVLKMVDDLVVTLKTEQRDDNDKKEYCAVQFDISDDKKKGLEKSISDLETSIIDAKDGLVSVKDEIDVLEDGIKALDKQVAEATEQRKEEHEDFSELMSSNAAAKELLGFAKNRLNKFYNPKLAKAASFIQIAKHTAKADPGPAPEAPGGYKKKGEESNGVIAMIDALVRDLDKEMTEAETIEKDSQSDYEQAMGDSKDKRADDSKSLTDKQAAQADMEMTLQSGTEEKKSNEKELMATESYISALHADCDWLVKYFDMRKEARDGEIDSLEKAKAVLSGADFSLLQTRSGKFLQK